MARDVGDRQGAERQTLHFGPPDSQLLCEILKPVFTVDDRGTTATLTMKARGRTTSYDDGSQGAGGAFEIPSHGICEWTSPSPCEVWYRGPIVTDFDLGNVKGVTAVREEIARHPGRYVLGSVVFNITVAE